MIANNADRIARFKVYAECQEVRDEILESYDKASQYVKELGVDWLENCIMISSCEWVHYVNTLTKDYSNLLLYGVVCEKTEDAKEVYTAYQVCSFAGRTIVLSPTISIPGTNIREVFNTSSYMHLFGTCDEGEIT